MRLTQKSLLKATWEYEVAEGKLVIREKSPFRLRESVVLLGGIDPQARAEAKKVRYRDDLPDDKKLELVERHLEFLRFAEVLSAAEVAELTARARKRFHERKVTVLNPAANSPMRADA